MQIRFEDIYQLSRSILASQAKDTISPALNEALVNFCDAYQKDWAVKSTSKALVAVLSQWKQELAKSKSTLPQQCEQLLTMLEFMPCFQECYRVKIQDILFEKFERHFLYSSYKSELESIRLTEKGLIFNFTSARAQERCKTILGYFNFHLSQYDYSFKLSIPHQQVYKLFAISFYSEISALIVDVKKFYAEANMNWKTACENAVATVDEKNVPKLHDHFQHYFLLLDIDKKIHVELTTLGCIFFVSNWDGENHIETLFNNFQKQQLAVQKPKISDPTWFKSFHSANPHLPEEFKNFFQEDSYKSYRCILIPPHCLERLLSITAFAPKHIIYTALVDAYIERKLDYHAVIIQDLANQGLSAPSDPNLSMTCHYAETEDDILTQWSVEPKALIDSKQDSEKHVLILLDDTSSLINEHRNKQLHEVAIATCIYIIDTLPDNVIITFCTYQSGYANIDQVKKSNLKPRWKENFEFINPRDIDQKVGIFGTFISRLKDRKIPISTVINISKDFNINSHPSVISILQSSFQTAHVPYIPVIIGAPRQSEINSTIKQYSHFVGHFVIDSNETIPIILGKTIANAMATNTGPALCGIAYEGKQTVLFKQPIVTFIDGFSYHAYSCIPKAYWQQQNPEKNLRLILRFEDKTIISSPKFHLITEQQDIEKLKGACSRSRIHSQFLLNDEVSFELESKKEMKQPDPAPKKAVANIEATVNPPPLFPKTLEPPQQTDLQPPSHTTPQVVPKLENVQPQKLENAQPQNPSKAIEVIKRLFSLSTAIQLTAFLILLGLVLSGGYGALIITGLVILSIGLVSQLVINYLDHQNWQQNTKKDPAESYLDYEFKQLIPSSLGGKCLMGLGIAASIILFGFCIGFIMADPVSISLLSPIFNAMQHFLFNGMLDINLSGIPSEIIEIISNTMGTLFLSTIPLVAMLFFRTIHDVTTGCASISESIDETEDLSKNPIDYSDRQQKDSTVLASTSPNPRKDSQQKVITPSLPTNPAVQ